jgi:cytochrome c-type biogenesis protein CcmH/NrfG
LNRERWGEAEDAFARAYALQPHNPLVLRYYARAKTGADQGAMSTFEYARDHDIYPAAAAEAAKAERAYADDESLVKAAVAANPTNSYAYDLLAEYEASRGEFPAAIYALHRAIALDWTDVQARTTLARVLLQQDPMDANSEAEAQLVQALSIDPDYSLGSNEPPVASELHDLLQRQGRAEAAQALLAWQADHKSGDR